MHSDLLILWLLFCYFAHKIEKVIFVYCTLVVYLLNLFVFVTSGSSSWLWTLSSSSLSSMSRACSKDMLVQFGLQDLPSPRCLSFSLTISRFNLLQSVLEILDLLETIRSIQYIQHDMREISICLKAGHILRYACKSIMIIKL